MDGKRIWSKLATGSFPDADAILKQVEAKVA